MSVLAGMRDAVAPRILGLIEGSVGGVQECGDIGQFGGGPGGAAGTRRSRELPLARRSGPPVTGPPPPDRPAPDRPVSDRRVLYVIACAAPPAADVGQLVSLAQQRGWDVCVLTTPSGRRFTDIAALERQTGHPVRSEYKNPGEPDMLPDPDAVIIAPATVNTINKWAAGICDTLALGILVEAIGKRLPIVALPSTNQAHAAHPAFPENIGKLRSWGVSVLFGAGAHALPEPGAGGTGPDRSAWSATLDALDASTAQTQDG